MALQAGSSRKARRGAQDDGKLKRFVTDPGEITRYSRRWQIPIVAAMYTHGLPAPQVLQPTQIRRAVLRRADRRQVVRAVVAEPPAADELVQLTSKVTKDIRGERRKYNFAAGPGCLPKSVLETAQEELLNYNGAGVSVMEMSHRSKEFIDICDRAEKDLRELLGISDAYEVHAHPP